MSREVGRGCEARLKVGTGRGWQAPASAPHAFSQGEGSLCSWPLAGEGPEIQNLVSREEP